jgi:transposase
VEWLKKGLLSSKQRCPSRLSDMVFADEEERVAVVIIGVDPHKLSATIEVLDEREKVLGEGRFGTDRDGYRQMLVAGRRWPQRVWAVEGSNGIGRHVAQRLVADGEPVVDVPAKLSARARVFSTGHGRKTDATDAHAIAVVAVRTPGLAQVAVDGELVALRLLADRRDELAGARTRTANRLHRLLLELIPAGAPRFLSATQAKALLATVRPRDVAGRTRRQLAAELLADIVVLDRKLEDSDKRLTEAVAATGSGLTGLYGVGPVGAARILGDVGDIARFASKGPLRLVDRHRPDRRVLRPELTPETRTWKRPCRDGVLRTGTGAWTSPSTSTRSRRRSHDSPTTSAAPPSTRSSLAR